MAELTIVKTEAEKSLADAFAAAKPTLPGSGPVAAMREAAFRQFQARGLPNRRVEEYKYTDLRALMRDAKPLAAPPAKAAIEAARDRKPFDELDAITLTLLNGSFVPELSDLSATEAGLTVVPLSRALAEGHALVAEVGRIAAGNDDVMVALNTAFLNDGVIVEVAEGAAVDRPILVRHVFDDTSPAATFARVVLNVGKGARAHLIETFAGNDTDYQVNAALELAIADGAHVDHVKVIGEGGKALHVSSLLADIGAQARFNDFTFITGGAAVRNQLFVRFGGEETVARIHGASMLKARQHADTTLVADHAVGHCQSRELFKSVLDGGSRGVFQGKIIVQPHAQKTDGKMAAHALLLSEDAEADAKPELEIFADDVVCGHGATAGALNDDLLFYLRARGIPPKEAEALLIQAFIGEAVEGIEHAGLRELLMESAAAWLAARG
jgi:Fe-S cluster assembly protein SufD